MVEGHTGRKEWRREACQVEGSAEAKAHREEGRGHILGPPDRQVQPHHWNDGIQVRWGTCRGSVS